MFEGKILRVLSDPPLSGFENMSRDEVLWENLAKGENVVLRFFRWREKTLSVGRFQKTQDICWEYLHRHQIPLVRRPTGGRAILHQNEITLSLILPGTNDLSPRRYYRELKTVMVRALQEVGIPVDEEEVDNPIHVHSPACFSLLFPHELTTGGKKIAGIAQAKKEVGSLFQLSLPLCIDREEFASCFQEKDLVFKELQENFVSLFELGFDPQRREEIEEAIIESFKASWGVRVREDTWREEEMQRNLVLLQTKYFSAGYHRGK